MTSPQKWVSESPKGGFACYFGISNEIAVLVEASYGPQERYMTAIQETEARVRVLAVSPSPQDHHSLNHIFGHTAWLIENANSCSAALEKLSSEPAPVVLCERTLPDGDWKDLLAALRAMPESPYLVVFSQQADDRLWAEVLNLGAYDVLAKPFRATEVFRTVGLAWRHWMDKRKVQKSQVVRQDSAPSAPARQMVAGFSR